MTEPLPKPDGQSLGAGERTSPHRFNARDQIEELLGPEGEEDLGQLCELINNNEFVRPTGMSVDPARLKHYYRLVLRGLKYAEREYGEGALPSGYYVATGAIETEEGPQANWIGYLEDEDAIGVSALHLVQHAAKFYKVWAGMLDSHLPAGMGISAENHTTLQTIEECYHRYQVKVKGMKNPSGTQQGDMTSTLEQEITTVMEKAISDLDMTTFPLGSQTDRPQ